MRISPVMPPMVIFWNNTFCNSVLSERSRLRGTSSACAGAGDSAGAWAAASPPAVSSSAGMAFMISFRSSRSDFT